jgi:hypothetical protein
MNCLGYLMSVPYAMKASKAIGYSTTFGVFYILISGMSTGRYCGLRPLDLKCVETFRARVEGPLKWGLKPWINIVIKRLYQNF